MHFLVDADLPRSADDVLKRHGHEVVDVRDVGLRSAKDSEIARYAQAEGYCLVTGNFDFADIRNYLPTQYAGIVVMSVPRSTTSAYINHLLDGFLDQTDLLAILPGQLAIVEPGRVRMRRG